MKKQWHKLAQWCRNGRTHPQTDRNVILLIQSIKSIAGQALPGGLKPTTPEPDVGGLKVEKQGPASVLPHPGGVPPSRRLLSVTRLHTEVRVTRAMSIVMLKFRRYHSLRARQQSQTCLALLVDSVPHLL